MTFLFCRTSHRLHIVLGAWGLVVWRWRSTGPLLVSERTAFKGHQVYSSIKKRFCIFRSLAGILSPGRQLRLKMVAIYQTLNWRNGLFQKSLYLNQILFHRLQKSCPKPRFVCQWQDGSTALRSCIRCTPNLNRSPPRTSRSRSFTGGSTRFTSTHWLSQKYEKNLKRVRRSVCLIFWSLKNTKKCAQL